LKETIPEFTGFRKGAFEFLRDLSKHNNLKWFKDNRARYDNELILPARSFIVEMGQFFNRLNPSIRTEPKFNETIMRLNKDLRFAKGEPYRNYLLIHFGRFKMDSEFYVYMDPDNFDYGLFLNNSEGENFYLKKNLKRYRKEFISCIEKYKISKRFSFLELGKESRLIGKTFNPSKHIDILENQKFSLLQKSLKLQDKKIYSQNFLVEVIKSFTNLYPIYCFGITNQPLKLIEEFENHFGIIE